MELGGHRHDRIVDARRDQRLHIRQHLQIRRRPMRIAIGIRHRHQVDALQSLQITGVMATHHAQTDQTGPQILPHAHAPAFATVFTAATIRSRSCSVMLGCTGNDSTSRASISVTGRSTSVRNVAKRCTGVG